MCAERSHRLILRTVLSSALLLALGGVSLGNFQQTAAAAGEEDDKTQPSGAAVEIDGRPILKVYVPLGGISPEERATNTEQPILRFARKRTAEVGLIRVEDHGAWEEIWAGNEPLMAVTEGEATAEGRSRAQLAAEYAEIIRRTVSNYRQEHTFSALLRGLLFSLIATTGLFLVYFVLLRIRRVARSYLQRFVDQSKENSSAQPVRSRIVGYLVAPLIGTGIIVLTAVTVALLEIYAILILSFFPSTRYISTKLNRWTISELGHVFQMVWTYMPNLVIVIVFVIAARALIRVNQYIFQEIREGTLRVKGFYPDWAEPTAKLVRLVDFSDDCSSGFSLSAGIQQPSVSRGECISGNSALPRFNLRGGPWSGGHHPYIYAVLRHRGFRKNRRHSGTGGREDSVGDTDRDSKKRNRNDSERKRTRRSGGEL
jgi:hypothetical protein